MRLIKPSNLIINLVPLSEDAPVAIARACAHDKLTIVGLYMADEIQEPGADLGFSESGAKHSSESLK